MNFNILAYLIYGLPTIFTIVYVGKVLHQNGRHYVLLAFYEDHIVDFINNGLLIGYYLVNIGYVFITVSNWQAIGSGVQLVEMLGEKTGKILLLLGLLHFFNMIALKLFAKRSGPGLGTEKK